MLNPDMPGPARGALALILVLGLLARLPWLATDWRVSGDLALQRAWVQKIHARGLVELYDGSEQLYPPLTTMVLGGIGLLEQALARTSGGGASTLNLLVKLPACLADIGTAALIAVAVWARPRLALLAAAAYIFNPAVIYVSTFWGQLDSVYTFFLVAALVAFDKKRSGVAWVSMGLALGIKVQAAALVPVLVPATLARGGWRALVQGALILGGIFLVLTMPWWVQGQLDADFWRSVGLASRSSRVDVSGYNLWYLVLRDGVHTASSLDYPGGIPLNFRQAGFLLYGLYAGLIAWRVWREPQSDLALGAALSSLGLFMLPTEVHERFLFPVAALVLLAAAQSAQGFPRTTRTRWLWIAYAVISLTLSFNLITIAQPAFVVPMNLIAQPTDSTWVALLKLMAVGASALNLVLLVTLTGLYWKGKGSRSCAS